MATETKRSRDEQMLISAAETIGSTLGTLAAKAEAATKALTGRNVLDKAEQVTRKLTGGKLPPRSRSKRNAKRKSTRSKPRTRRASARPTRRRSARSRTKSRRT